MAYKDYIANMKKEWIGQKVLFDNKEYTVVDVDYNGGLLIDKKAEYRETTAVSPLQVIKL